MPHELKTREFVTLTLKPKEESRLLAGHPWVFSNELAALPKDVPLGTPALLHNSQGRTLGVGFYNPKSLISFRLLSRERVEIDRAFIRVRLERAQAFRERHMGGERSYRLCFGESDGLPGLIIDKYEDVFALQSNSAGMELLLPLVVEALDGLFEPKGVYLRSNDYLRKLEGLPIGDRLLFGDVPDEVLIEEAGIRYRVDAKGGQKTGFYFDQRDNRAALAPYFKRRNVLDLHCFSGAFSLTAGKSGAARVLGLDSSQDAVAMAQENARLNDLSDWCEFDAGDAGDILEAVSGQKQRFSPDMILLDPPNFAQSKKHLPKALKAYTRLVGLGLRILKSGGLLAMSTCSHHVSRLGFIEMLRIASANTGRPVRILELRGQAKDHPVLLSMPETAYLHFALLEVI